MSLDITAIPLAYIAGVLSILSPCVWPLVPVVMSSATTSGKSGPWWLALGLSLAFALVGTVLTYFLLNLGLGVDILRPFAAVLLLVIAIPLLFQRLGDWFSMQLSRLTSGIEPGSGATSARGQFGIGALLGVVWLPCVGPTLGAVIALAAMGQDMVLAFMVMFIFGMGTASVLLLVGLTSGRLLQQWRPGLLASAARGKKLLASMLVLLAVLVLTGWDKQLEAWALNWLPDWAVTL